MQNINYVLNSYRSMLFIQLSHVTAQINHLQNDVSNYIYPE